MLERLQRAGREEIHSVTYSRVLDRRRNHGKPHCLAKPGLEMKWARDALVAHLAGRRECAFYGYSAITRLYGQRLQHESGAVGFAEAVDASPRSDFLSIKPIHPAMNIVALFKPVGS